MLKVKVAPSVRVWFSAAGLAPPQPEATSTAAQTAAGAAILLMVSP
jgi:hypothetical protein